MTGKANIRDAKKRKAKQISNNSNINFNQGRGTSYKNGVSNVVSQPLIHTEGDLNLNTYDIYNVDRLLFATTSGAGDTITATDYGIEAIANGATTPYGITYQIPASKIHSFKVGTDVPLTLADNYVIIAEDLTTTNIEVGTHTIKFTETTTPSSPGTNKGVIYAKDVSGVTTPMWYDGTTETSLLGGGSGGADTSLSNLTSTGEAHFANPTLSNLGTTSVNANIIPQAGKLLGSDGNEWARVHSNNYRLGTAGTVSASSNDITGTTSGIYFNVPTGLLFNFRVNNGSIGTITHSGTVSFPNFIASTSLHLNDATSYPGTNGSIYREGNDVKIFSGGSEINMSSIGGGWVGTATSDLNMNGNSIHDSTGSLEINDNIDMNGHYVSSAQNIRFDSISWSGVGGAIWYDGTNLKGKASTGNSFTIGSSGGWVGTAGSDLDMAQFDIDDVDNINFDGAGGNINFDTTGYLKLSGVNQIYLHSSGVHFYNDIEMMGGVDVDFQTGGTVDFYDIASSNVTGGSFAIPSNPVGYFKVKYRGSDRYIPYYS